MRECLAGASAVASALVVLPGALEARLRCVRWCQGACCAGDLDLLKKFPEGWDQQSLTSSCLRAGQRCRLPTVKHRRGHEPEPAR